MVNLSYAQIFQNLISKSAYFLYLSRWLPGRSKLNRSRAWALEQRSFFYALPVDEQEKRILKRLREHVAYCRQFVPYYRNILRGFPMDFPRNLMEFRKIPVLEKSTLYQVGDALVSDEFSKSQLIKHSTGGSTGAPVTVYLLQDEDGLGKAGNDYYMHLIGGDSGKRIATLYGGDLDISARPTPLRKINDWFLNITNYGCFRLDDQYLLSVNADFEKFKPDLLLGYASALYLLASLLKKKGIRPTYPCNTILTAAEKLENYQRAVIEDVFRVPIVERYGSRELGLMAYQKIGDRRMWVDRWDYLIEPAEQPDNQGRASLVVSRLHTKAMPLLRYRIGDLATFPYDWSVAHPVSHLEEINGRVLDYIYLPNGSVVHGSEFPHLFKDFDIVLYQVLQQASGDVCVSILAGDNFDLNQRSCCERIITENLPGVKIDFKYPHTLERTAQNKLRPVISLYSPD